MEMMAAQAKAVDPQILLLLAPVVVLQIGLQIAALFDLAKKDRAVRGDSKALWAILIVAGNIWGVLIYFWMGREEGPARRDTAGTAAPPAAPAPRPAAPPRPRYEAIRTEGLGKDFGRLRALDSLDLVVEGPGVFGFLGPNGAGKSTTIRMLTGLSRPTRGRAWIAGKQVNLETGTTAALCGYLAEDPQYYPWMTGREFLIFTGQLFGLSGPDLARRADELLELVNLREAGARRLGGYSRGMRQRLGIAHALIHRPPVLILDEPVSALDPLGRRDVLDLIARLGEEYTVFMSTHILADVERVCERVAVLNAGQLITTARTEELRERYAQPIFEVEFEHPQPEFADGLRGLPWVAGVEQHGTLTRVVVADVAAARMSLLPLVSATGVPLLRYEQVLPSLEDVFVRLVGTPPGPGATASPAVPAAPVLVGEVK